MEANKPMFETPTKEELQELHRKHMKFLREYKNNFSYWFPFIKNISVPGVRIPKSVIIDVPEDLYKAFFMEEKDDASQIVNWFRQSVVPVVKREFPSQEVFIKNGCFSGKFRFDENCHVRNIDDVETVARQFSAIQYDSLMMDKMGELELIVREYIPAEPGTKTIYHGMPLRPEIRVFYDFSNNLYLYTVNYWDWDECHEAICRHPEDAKVYEKVYPQIKSRLSTLLLNHMGKICKVLGTVENLSDIWSVDFILEDRQIWLIDMATAGMSTYWDPERVIKMYPGKYRRTENHK